MVPFLNALGTDVACVGVSMQTLEESCVPLLTILQNHDLDFGIDQFEHLRDQCKFPWLLANVFDPGLGEGIPLGNCKKTYILTSSNGIKIGFIGLAEREWYVSTILASVLLTRSRLETINALPPNLIYKSASQTAEELVPDLRKEGCELIVAVTHMREPNDNKLAEKTTPGLIDLVLGGHDHYYNHSLINSTHVLRSGTDFRQLSYIQGWKKETGGWDFNIIRRDIVRSIPEDPTAVKLVEKLTNSLKNKLEKPIGYTSAPLDGRFTTVRTRESNLGNFVCDLMRYYYQADCALMAAGTIRGDQVYPPGILRLKDIMNCFPFEDPVVVLKLTGKDLLAALENSVSMVPALEGRYPQVSNIQLEYHPELQPGSRIQWVKVDGKPLDQTKTYTLATRGYMARGKDGFDSLLPKSDGGSTEEIVSEENGMLISTILRQYFMSLKVMGKWHRWGTHLAQHWHDVHSELHEPGTIKEPQQEPPRAKKHKLDPSLKKSHKRHNSFVDSDSDNDDIDHSNTTISTHLYEDGHFHLAKSVAKKWMRLAGIQRESIALVDEEEFTPEWTKGIAPRIEGRIRITNTT